MAALSLYDTKSFLNHCRKSPVNFPAEQYCLSAMRAFYKKGCAGIKPWPHCSRNVTGIAADEWSKGCESS